MIAVGCLVVFGLVMGLAFPYYAGCVVVSALLVYRRRMISPEDLSRMGAAFMRINAYVSTTVLVAVILSLAVA